MVLSVKDIKGFEDCYSIDCYGGVFSKKRNIMMKPRIDRYGYPRIGLYKNGIQKHINIHRLLGLNFLPNPDNLPTIDHIDGNPLNNDLTNLRWASHTTQSINHTNCRNNKYPLHISYHTGDKRFRVKIQLDKTTYEKWIPVRDNDKEEVLQQAIEYRDQLYKDLNLTIIE